MGGVLLDPQTMPACSRRLGPPLLDTNLDLLDLALDSEYSYPPPRLASADNEIQQTINQIMTYKHRRAALCGFGTVQQMPTTVFTLGQFGYQDATTFGKTMQTEGRMRP